MENQFEVGQIEIIDILIGVLIISYILGAYYYNKIKKNFKCYKDLTCIATNLSNDIIKVQEELLVELKNEVDLSHQTLKTKITLVEKIQILENVDDSSNQCLDERNEWVNDKKD